MSKRCVWVREIAILKIEGDDIAYWEVWDSHNTRKEAVDEARRDFENRPSWVTAKFHRATNRIVKYMPTRDRKRE